MALKFEFVTKDIFNFIRDTDSRIQRMEEILIEKNLLGFFRIEGKDIKNEWDDFYPDITEKIKTLRRTVDIGQSMGHKLAFFLHFVALFFKYRKDEEDKDYIAYVNTFLNEHADLFGPIEEGNLFHNAFPK